MNRCATFGCSGRTSVGDFCVRCWGNLPAHLRRRHLDQRGATPWTKRDEPLSVPILEILQSRQRLTNHA